jgi:hypothetical protein
MQEKSNTEDEYRKTALDTIVNYVWRNDDFVVTIGICIAVMSLFKLTCVISMSQ